ncbi:GLPGLI family protein [Empedobacter stercoris]|uniref:GLPGLI family protein n=1 Tax=Empedobacter TaxID=59734 RepID=UPI0021B00665|nr:MULTISPECIES: GLPGLI family protein [Empedobacter]MDM1522179.1 GLPGLI family protein [Empedobacter sp. 225-1]MDM1542438.1 GLPGLI family protein [Empedobacter sp. 189-2]UWX66787.1 GLPGLI family protein [Empedobacter stercoris]
MKNFLTLIIIISSFAQAQFYEIAYKVQPQIHFTDKALENLKQYYPDQKQREEFLESAKKIPSQFYSFKYNESQSQSEYIDKVDNSQEAPQSFMGISPDIGANPIFNYEDNLYFNEVDMFTGNKFLVYDSLEKVNFVETGKTKTILGIETKEATAKYKNYDLIAWYAPQISYSYSPDKFYGTKGLILELHYKYLRDDIEVMISWNATKKKELKKSPVFKINNKLKKVSQAEFLQMIEDSNQIQREAYNQGVEK